MHPDTYPRLVGDVGGTHARFGWLAAPDAPISDMATYPNAAHAGLLDAMRHYLAQHAKPQPAWCAIGIANPVSGDHVQMTNLSWSFSIRELREALGLERLLVLNDFTALALSLPGLGPGELRAIGGGEARAGAPKALLGPGTGLGVSGLLPVPGGHWVAINGEGGHATLAAGDDFEAEVIAVLRRRFEHVSAERALSGPGLENLYEAVCTLAGRPAAVLGAPAIAQAALGGGDADCVAALELFCALLGSVAGNLALALGAHGGVYIGGGIVPRLGDWFARSRFRECFVAKGRFRGYLDAMPTWVITAENPALLGAARALDGPG
ncbi:glucokinase [Caldimonas tepidiphila]|uniref:glucokinase n=1 Tax=Caldimonas tepidiphila TaxID=2315841 RepID=UPI000E5B922B|nr:glucokinase [Caldimonas tepidiphila]